MSLQRLVQQKFNGRPDAVLMDARQPNRVDPVRRLVNDPHYNDDDPIELRPVYGTCARCGRPKHIQAATWCEACVLDLAARQSENIKRVVDESTPSMTVKRFELTDKCKRDLSIPPAIFGPQGLEGEPYTPKLSNPLFTAFVVVASLTLVAAGFYLYLVLRG